MFTVFNQVLFQVLVAPSFDFVKLQSLTTYLLSKAAQQLLKLEATEVSHWEPFQVISLFRKAIK